MNEPLKLCAGIVGCGYQGDRLARAIALVDTLTVTACADIIPERAVALAAFTGGASAYASAEEMLANSAIDVVMVATPHHVLGPISLLAIQAGKHVLCEKPCGMNAAELAKVEKAAARAGVSYLAGYSFRYIPAWYKVQELLKQGVIGETLAVMGYIGVGAMDEGWKSTPETGGGPLLYVGSHLVDQVLWYLQDDPVEVYASTRFRSDTRADEITAFQVKFAKGATAQLMSTQTDDTGFTHHLNIYGREGSISMRPVGFLDYEVTVSSRVVEEYRQPAVIHLPIAGDVRDVKHSRQLTEFVQSIRSDGPVFVTAHQARRVMEVIDAVFASSLTSKPVRVG
jgi:phthalate 4,5-cis-dihydrodiol dehydrogenase